MILHSQLRYALEIIMLHLINIIFELIAYLIQLAKITP
jgi:hypothetical protein